MILQVVVVAAVAVISSLAISEISIVACVFLCLTVHMPSSGF